MTALKGTTGRLLDGESAAESLGVRPSTIRDCWRIAKLHRVKIGRVTRVWESEISTLVSHEEKGGG